MQLRNLVGLLLAASFLAGCNIPAPSAPDGNQQAVASAVAQTMVSVQTPQAGQTPGAPAPSQGGEGSAASPTTTVTATATKSGEKMTLSINGNSNCRSGPGGSYKNVTSFTPGIKLEVLTYSPENNYYQVKIPNTEETCWVWGQYADASVKLENIPTADAAALATSGAVGPAVPSRPGAITYTYTCDSGVVNVDLRWRDASDDEKGFHVYLADALIADLPANSTTYHDALNVPYGSTLKFAVASYNDAGESAPQTQTFTVCQ